MQAGTPPPCAAFEHAPTRYQRLALADVPAHLAAAFATTVTALEAPGFTPLGWSSTDRSVPFDDVPLVKCWLEHRKEAAYASAYFPMTGANRARRDAHRCSVARVVRRAVRVSICQRVYTGGDGVLDVRCAVVADSRGF